MTTQSIAVQSGRRPSERSRLLAGLCFVYAVALPYDIVRLGGSYALPTFVGAILLVMLVHRSVVGEPSSRPQRGIELLVLYVLGVWTTLTCIWSIAQETALASAAGMLINIAITIFLAPVFHTVWRQMFAGYALSALYLSGTLINGEGQESWARAQFYGADENITAFALTVAVACALGLARSARLPLAVTLYGMAAFHSVGVFYTGSRTGLLSLASLFAVAALASLRGGERGHLVRRSIPWLVGGASAFGLMRLLSSGAVSQRLLDFSGASLSGDRARSTIVERYLIYINDWALWGVGQGSDAAFLKSESGTFINSHGLFWKTWIELGVVGLSLYAFLILCIIVKLRSGVPWRTEKFLLLAALVPFAISLGAQSSAIFWFVVCACLAVSEPAKSNDVPMDGHLPNHRQNGRDSSCAS